MKQGTTFALLIVTPILTAFGQALIRTGMKSVAERTPDNIVATVVGAVGSPAVVAGLTIYVLCTLSWLLLLSRFELSFAYPFLGLSFIVALVLGVSMLGEPVSMIRIVGTILIGTGVVLVAAS